MNVANVLLKIIIIKLPHSLSYLCKHFVPIPCIHHPDTLWCAVTFSQKAKFLYLKTDFLPYIHSCNLFHTSSNMSSSFLSRLLTFLWKNRCCSYQGWNICLNEMKEILVPWWILLFFCVTQYLVIQRVSLLVYRISSKIKGCSILFCSILLIKQNNCWENSRSCLLRLQ